MDRLIAGLDGEALWAVLAQAARACGAARLVLARAAGGLALAWGTHRPGQCLLLCEDLATHQGGFELLVFGESPARAGDAPAMRQRLLPFLADLRAAIDAEPEPLPRLRADGARLLSAIDRLSDCFLMVGRDWRILHVNPAFEALVHASAAELVGRTLWDAFPEGRSTAFEAQARATLADGQPRVCEQYVPARDRWFESRLFACDEGLMVLAADVTQRRMEAQSRSVMVARLAERQRMESLGTLASGIAHDFNNVLTIILGHATLLMDKVGEHSPLRADLQRIDLAGRRARDLVRRILAFGRREPGDSRAAPLVPLVEDSLALLRATLPANVQLLAEMPAESLCTTAGGTDVHQLVANLVTNAWHALRGEAGQVYVHLARETVAEARAVASGRLAPGPHARLTVRDTGCGMDEATVRRVFEPFFTTKAEGVGTGLGLHVVAGVAQRHGGAVDLQSRPGMGSVFTVWLPALRAPADDGGAIAPVAPRRAAGERVAFVDDDSVVSVVVEQVLRRAGFEVTCFGQPVLALKALQDAPDRYRCLVSDQGMPQMTGVELARHVQRLALGVPVVLVSGLVDEDLVREAAACGVARVLHKERAVEDLADAVLDALRAAQAGTGVADSAGEHPPTTPGAAAPHPRESP